MDLKELLRMREFMGRSDEFSVEEWSTLNKICAEKVRETYEDLCKEHRLCPRCGKTIDSDGTMTVGGSGHVNPRAYRVKVSV